MNGKGALVFHPMERMLADELDNNITVPLDYGQRIPPCKAVLDSTILEQLQSDDYNEVILCNGDIGYVINSRFYKNVFQITYRKDIGKYYYKLGLVCMPIDGTSVEIFNDHINLCTFKYGCGSMIYAATLSKHQYPDVFECLTDIYISGNHRIIESWNGDLVFK